MQKEKIKKKVKKPNSKTFFWPLVQDQILDCHRLSDFLDIWGALGLSPRNSKHDYLLWSVLVSLKKKKIIS